MKQQLLKTFTGLQDVSSCLKDWVFAHDERLRIPDKPMCAHAEMTGLLRGHREIFVSCAAPRNELADDEVAIVVEVPIDDNGCYGKLPVLLEDIYDGGATIGASLREEDYDLLFEETESMNGGMVLPLRATHASRGFSEITGALVLHDWGTLAEEGIGDSMGALAIFEASDKKASGEQVVVVGARMHGSGKQRHTGRGKKRVSKANKKHSQRRAARWARRKAAELDMDTD